MLSRNLGQSEISVSAIGLGCMGLSEFYGEPMPASEAINLLHRAVDLGITHFDTAELYGQGRNEQLLGKAFAGRWDQIVLATNLQTNLGAPDCRLTEENRATLNELADQVLGDRYAPEGMAAINR
jgi:aryl-alcohol dehydrogenase-like predicted oxidoreductase